MTKITIKDVARHAGLHPSTVSRAINNHPEIKPETRARILQTIEELGFIPDRAARSFRTGKTRSVSVILPSSGNDFYIRLINSIDETLEEHDYDAGVYPLLSERRLTRYQNPSALPYQTDGLILASLDPEQLYDNLLTIQGLPTVVLEVHSRHFDSVTLNNALAGKLAARHLLERPTETFVIRYAASPEQAGVPSNGVFEERLQGFLDTFKEAGAPLPAENVLSSNFDEDQIHRAVQAVLEQRKEPINVFAVCDDFTRVIIEGTQVRGLTLEDDVRLVGYDHGLRAHHLGLTSVFQPVEDMGRKATEMLMERIANPTLPVRHLELDPVLRVGLT